MRRMMKTAPIALVFAIAWLGAANAGEVGASDWSKGPLSSARLISAGGLSGGVYHAAVEITLKGNAHTYWRNPGDAGAPPVFHFESSSNLADARPKFPAPMRIAEDGLDVFGYLRSVVIPIEIKPRDPGKPVEFSMRLQYAACERICIPAEADATSTLSPVAAATPFTDAVAAANAALPTPLAKGGPALRVAAKPGAPKPTWSIAFEPPVGAGADLFSEAPEGWFFDTKRAADGGFDLILEEKPADANSPVAVELTMVDGDRSFVTSIRLDGGTATP
jgi:DsbC/DsbD-like thiol-disulfide interchange protein